MTSPPGLRATAAPMAIGNTDVLDRMRAEAEDLPEDDVRRQDRRRDPRRAR